MTQWLNGSMAQSHRKLHRSLRLDWHTPACGRLVTPLAQNIDGPSVSRAAGAIDDRQLVQPAVNSNYEADLQVSPASLRKRRHRRRQRLGRKHRRATVVCVERWHPVVVGDGSRLAMGTRCLRRDGSRTHAHQQHNHNHTAAGSGAHGGRRPIRPGVLHSAICLPGMPRISAGKCSD